MKTLCLVNGVPASGKSTVARAVAQITGWPLLTLDTVKEPFFDHLGTGDRTYNRQLGKASYQAMFALLRDWPAGSAAVMDAWFGFQPLEVLQGHVQKLGECRIGEIWCHAPPALVGERYQSRLAGRHAGHLGADYVPELITLAGSAKPTGLFPLHNVDTSRPLDVLALKSWITTTLHPDK